MALHYSKPAVIFAFHRRDPADLAPTVAELEQEDADLFEGFDGLLEEQMPLFGIEVTRRSKSRVLMLALVSNGATRRVKTVSACRYYAHAWSVVRPLPFV